MVQWDEKFGVVSVDPNQQSPGTSLTLADGDSLDLGCMAASGLGIVPRWRFARWGGVGRPGG
jgi:hypothetical protein